MPQLEPVLTPSAPKPRFPSYWVSVLPGASQCPLPCRIRESDIFHCPSRRRPRLPPPLEARPPGSPGFSDVPAELNSPFLCLDRSWYSLQVKNTDPMMRIPRTTTMTATATIHGVGLGKTGTETNIC